MQTEGSDASSWPFAGLRVLELSTGIAGPYCGKLLVDAGADVVKLEPPQGDALRRWTASGTPLADEEAGALFQFLNASKQSAVVDVSREGDLRLVRELAARADLVLHDFTQARAGALGLSLETLQAANPALCVVSITPWGGDGPFADRPCTEFTLQAATGSVGYRGLRDRRPVAAGGRFGEWLTGVYAAVGALSAWLSARADGRGQQVDVSMFEAMLLSMTVYHDLNGQWVPGDLARSVEIPSIEPAKDGWVGFCTITGQQWKDFCALIGQPEVASDDGFLDARRRMDHQPFMREIIHAFTRERSVDEIVELASLMRIPVAPVGSGRTLPQMDHLVARRVFTTSAAGFLQPRVPYRLEKTPTRPFGPAPKLDADAEEVRGGQTWSARGHSSSRTSERERTALPQLPLKGLRVVDLTAFWAGPFATCYLADLGADVVKVESIQRPDGMRFAGAVPKSKLWEWSPVFAGANPGKRDVTLQLDDPRGMALLRELIAGADVVIENFSVRVLENFGLGWDEIRALSPRVILVRMPAFGLDGPWRDRTGFAMTIEQVSGLAWITGYEDLPLVVRGACDPVGGMQTVFALLAALEHRRHTGEGQLVEVPLLENALNLAAEQVIEYSAYGELLTRAGNRGPVSAPQGLYRCADDDSREGYAREQYVAIAIADDAQWRRLCARMGDPAWSLAQELAHAAGRRARHDEIDRQLDAWLSGQRRDEATERLVAAGVPAAAVINAHRVMPNPQLEARGFFQTLLHPETGAARYPGFPMRFSHFGPGLHPSPPPTLGQHNEDILSGELGLTQDELAILREAKVIGERPSFL
jgi:crotonobetainyl-CoA:carnitine CoA-transferase CaiB-like acyl-CoA transferase